ncbi:hypothetical protein JCM8097_005478 [Rhodosporidiobolus ruineniae]
MSTRDSSPGPPTACPPPLSALVDPCAHAAFQAHLDAMADDTWMGTELDTAAGEVVVKTYRAAEGDDAHDGVVVDEARFPKSERAEEHVEAQKELERERARWMLRHTREEIEEVFGWPEGISEEEFFGDLRASLGEEKDGETTE